jgi:hypothetical protein
MPAFAETLTSGRIQADLTDIVASAAGTPAAAGAPFGYKTPDGAARVVYRDGQHHRDLPGGGAGILTARHTDRHRPVCSPAPSRESREQFQTTS